MAHADTLPSDVIDHVASQISAEAGRALGAAVLQKKSMEMTESFSVWALGLDAITKPNVDLTQVAHQTGKWHHQIKLDGKAESFARSTPLGANAESWSVRELFTSEIAGKIDEVIDWVDRNVKGDPLARLLIVPAFHLHAFWLVESGKSHVVIVDMPRGFSKLEYRKLYTSREFLDALVQEQHIIGITAK